MKPEDCYFIVKMDEEGAFGDYEGDDIVVMITAAEDYDNKGRMSDYDLDCPLPVIIKKSCEMENTWIQDRERFPNITPQVVANVLSYMGYRFSTKLASEGWWESEVFAPNGHGVEPKLAVSHD